MNEKRLNEPSDAAIIARVLNEDMNAFEIIVRRYDRLVSDIVSKHTARAQVADVAQEIFIQAYKSLPYYRLNMSFPKWLAKIAAMSCVKLMEAAGTAEQPIAPANRAVLLGARNTLNLPVAGEEIYPSSVYHSSAC